MTTLILSSEEFGTEEFEYETYAEAVAGMERIMLAAEKLSDGVDRRYSIEGD